MKSGLNSSSSGLRASVATSQVVGIDGCPKDIHRSLSHMARPNPAARILVRMAGETDRPVITEFDFYLLARRLFRDRP